MFNKKNKKYIPPQNMIQLSSQVPTSAADNDMADFTKSYVPEDEGSGYMLGYLSIVFGLLFNIIGMVLGVVSIVRGFRKNKIALSLLGIAGIAAGVLSVWLYIQAFQLILPGVTYDRDTSSWVIREDGGGALQDIEKAEYFIRAPDGESFIVSLPAGLETRKSDDDIEHDFFMSEDAAFQEIGDFKATVLFFADSDEAMSSGDIRDLTNEVIHQDQSAIESASLGVLRDEHFGIAPDTIEVIEPTDRMSIDHGYFEEILSFEVMFNRVVDQQIVPTKAFVGLLYHRDRVVLLSMSSSLPEVIQKDTLAADVLQSFLPR